jgi:hypothetical protein
MADGTAQDDITADPGARSGIGQCGVEKSGNYLLYRVLRTLLEQAGAFRSHAAATGCWDSLFALDGIPLSFPEQRDLDEAEIHDGQVYALNSHLKARFAVRDEARFAREAALVWTHQAPTTAHGERLGTGRRWLYLVRDGRDVVNSWIHYAVSPRMRARHPEYRIDRPEDLYALSGYFERAVERWVAHVEAFLTRADRYRLVRYEDLVRDKPGEVKRLADATGLSARVDVDAVVEATRPERTRRDAPRHVRTATTGDWRAHFGPRHEAAYRERTARVIDALGVAEYATW